MDQGFGELAGAEHPAVAGEHSHRVAVDTRKVCRYIGTVELRRKRVGTCQTAISESPRL
jgi:hypothetical protein